MVANRLTWQNVAAPDFSTALEGVQGAGQAWARGFDGLSGALGDWRTRQKEQASAEALNKAMGITDSAGWDQAMAGGGGLQALGINSRDATPELLNFVTGRRGELIDQESGIADQKIKADAQAYLTNVLRPRDAADRARLEAGWAQADLETKNNNANYAKTITAQTRDLELKNKVLDLVQKNKGKSKEELSVLLENSGLNPVEAAQAIGHLTNIDEAIFNPTATNARAAANSTVMREGQQIANKQESTLTWNNGLSSEMRVLAEGSKSFGTGDGVAEKLVTNLLGDSGDEKWKGNDNFGNSSAKILDIFNDMMQYGYDPKTGTQLPPELVAQVIKNNLKGDGWITSGDPAIDQSKVKQILDTYKDPVQIEAMRQVTQERDTQRLNLDAFNAGLKEFERKLGNALENGTPADVEAIKEQAYEFYRSSGFENPKTTENTTDAPTPQQAAEIARAEAAMAQFGDPKNYNAASAAQKAGTAVQKAMAETQTAKEQAAFTTFKEQVADEVPASVVDPALGAIGAAATSAPGLAGSFLKTGIDYRFPGAASGAKRVGNAVFGTVANAVVPESTPGPNIQGNLWDQTSEVDKAYMLSAELNMSQEESSTLTVATDALETGVNPKTGTVLSDTEQRAMETKVAEIIKKALKARGDLPLTPELAQLIASNTMWQSALSK